MSNKLITREITTAIKLAFDVFPVVTLTGPRQSGKTTLCRSLFPELPYVNLEDFVILHEVQNDIRSFFAKYPDGLIIDEAQNFPQILSQIQVIVDDDRFHNRTNRKFLVTGSCNFALLESVTQSMAGRTSVLSLLPLSYNELAASGILPSTDELILNGGYPAVWHCKAMRRMIMSNYVNTYIERDIRNILNIKDVRSFQLFLQLCAGRVGAEFNASKLASEVGVSVNTIQSWLSILCTSYVTYMLPPYYANISKRTIKSSKLYFYDTGLVAHLLGIETEQQLSEHPQRGQLYENMVINNILKNGLNKGENELLFFYRDKAQHEVDLVRQKALKLQLFEIKSSRHDNTDFYKHLHYLQNVFGNQISRSAVIYDGDDKNDKPFDGLYNFREFDFYS